MVVGHYLKELWAVPAYPAYLPSGRGDVLGRALTHLSNSEYHHLEIHGVRQTVTTNSVQLPSELSSRTILLLGSIREEVRRYWVVSRSSVLKVSWQTVKFSEGSFWEWLLWFWFYRTEPEQFFRLLLFGFVEVVTQRANGVCGISSRAQSLVGWI